MPGERLEWTGCLRAFDRQAWRQLARRLGLALLVGIGGTLAVGAGLLLWWPIRNQQMAGDVRPLSDWLSNLAVNAAWLLALAIVGVLLFWLGTQRRLSRTRYAITDRRVIERRHDSTGTAIGCLLWAAADPGEFRGPDNSLVVGVSPSTGTAAVGTLITAESIALEALGPARDAAFAVLLAKRQRRHGDTRGSDAPPETVVWSGQAIKGVIWDAKLLGQVAGFLFLLPFVLIGVAMSIACIAALFGYLTVVTLRGYDEPFAIGTLLISAASLLGFWGTIVFIFSKALAGFRNRNRRRFQVIGQEALVVPDSPFAGVESCTISPDMRFDLWLGRRPHLRFVGRVDKSEGGKSLTRVGFDAPEDPMGAYMALVAAREAAARGQSDRTGTT